MSDSRVDLAQTSAEIGEEELRRVEELIEKEEGATNRFGGLWGATLTALAVSMTLFHLYAAWATVPQQLLREVHVAFALGLIFLLFPALPSWRSRIAPWDLVLTALVIWTIWYMIEGGDDFLDRYVSPSTADLVAGGVLIVLILEATRRTTGLIMPIVCLLFWAYAAFGPQLPQPWTHKGYGINALIAELYMTLNGVFGNAIDVSATVIILFTIFGAVLQASGAGKFFIDFSMLLMKNRPNAAGRAVVLSSFLLGGPSGSGVATTVTIGTVAWPIMRRAGYRPTAAGGLLAAGGLGALLSPPVLGAAAFLIAEYLKLSYLDVVRMATIPTLLYYLGLLAMTEIDARKYGLRSVDTGMTLNVGQLLMRYGFHFSSLISVIVLMIWGYSSTYAVFWSILLAIGVSFMRSDTALKPMRLIMAFRGGAVEALGVAATCASAGIIVGIVTKTGLALKFSGIVIDLAGGSLTLTALYTALIVWIVGLAVPVTASYIMCAVIAAPALIKLGVPDFAAHMFIFYYAVLSEVSPPTALSPFAAAALTRSDPYVTTLQSWKYALPAFLVPIMFVLDPLGPALLLSGFKNLDLTTSILQVLWVSAASTISIVGLAAATQGYFARKLGGVEWLACILASIVTAFPGIIGSVTGSATTARAIAIAVLLVLLARQLVQAKAKAA